jgi:PAT family beta-lactamase induction signal transducer AmpG
MITKTDTDNNDTATIRKKAPGWWVPSLYFAEGLPNVTVTMVAAVMLKNFGVQNDVITHYVGPMWIAWMIKPFWAPFVDVIRTKRTWAVAMQFMMAVSLGCLAMSLSIAINLKYIFAFLWVTAFLSATHDIAADGVYLLAMNKNEQRKWVGAQSMFWMGSQIIATGALMTLSGYLHESYNLNWAYSWMTIMGIIAGIIALLALWHFNMLPKDAPIEKDKLNIKLVAKDTMIAWKDFFKKPHIGIMIAFILLYRLGEAQLQQIGPLFMIDSKANGGLGLSNQLLGDINGTYGTVAMILSALLGGFFVYKKGLNKKVMLILILSLNLPNLTYLFLSAMQPSGTGYIALFVIAEKFGAGFGEVGLMIYIMQQIAPGKFQTSHFAFGTGFMATAMFLASTFSGDIQMSMGYMPYFALVTLVTIPSFIISWFAPYPTKTSTEKNSKDNPADSATG